MKKRILRLLCVALIFGAVATANSPKANAISDGAHTFCLMYASGWAGPDMYWGTCTWYGGNLVGFTPLVPAG